MASPAQAQPLTAQHWPVARVAEHFGVKPRWVLDRLRRGELRGFFHSSRLVTVAVESIRDYEQARAFSVSR